MNEMRAIVLHLHGGDAEISPVGHNGCGHCADGKGCGSGKLSQLFCSSKPRTFMVENRAGANIGEEVSVGLPDGILLRHSILMYLMPLSLMLGGALLCASLLAHMRDAGALFGAIAGLLAGFFLVRRMTRRAGSQAVVRAVVRAAHP